MMDSTSYKIISSYMPQNIRDSMGYMNENDFLATEIRLRSGRAVSFIFPDKIRYLAENGKLTKNFDNPKNIIVKAEDINQTVERLCHFSIHSCYKELHEGYFVLKNGIRVGIAGTYSNTSEKTISSFNALNFRVSRCIKGCAMNIFEKTMGRSILICGGVNSGKTTILRDLCRLSGNSFKVALIDERNEISATSGGIPENDVGVLTDILINCNRSHGIISAVRTLSPDMIFCDEISTSDDVIAILQAHGCGVKFSATVHAENYENLLKRQTIKPLLENKVFEYAVFLENIGKVREIRRLL